MQLTLCTVKITVCSFQRAVCSMMCAVDSVHCALHSVQFEVEHCTAYSAVYSVQCTVQCSIKCSLQCTVQCTVQCSGIQCRFASHLLALPLPMGQQDCRTAIPSQEFTEFPQIPLRAGECLQTGREQTFWQFYINLKYGSHISQIFLVTGSPTTSSTERRKKCDM